MPRSLSASASSGPSPRRWGVLCARPGTAGEQGRRGDRAPARRRNWLGWLLFAPLLLLGALLWAPLAGAAAQQPLPGDASGSRGEVAQQLDGDERAVSGEGSDEPSQRAAPARAASAQAHRKAATDGAVRTGVSQPRHAAADGAVGQPKDALELPSGVPLPPAPEGFNTYDGGWLKVAFPPSVRHRVQPLIHDADAFRQRMRELFGHPVLEQVYLRVARTPGEMATLAPPDNPFPKYAEGVAYPGIGLVLLTIEPLHPNSVSELGEVFQHELAHVALYDALNGQHVPLWLNEGFAIHLSGESTLTRWQTLSTATLSDTLLPLSQLEWRFPDDLVQTPIAYAESADVVRHLLRTRYTQRFVAMLHRVRGGQAFEAAMLDAYGFQVYGIGANSLEDEWRRDVAKRYTFWPVLFSGSMLWIGVLGLFTVGYFKNRSKQRLTLERWAIEEAAEDRPKLRDPAFASRMHIVLAPKPAPAPEAPLVPEFKKGGSEVDVPKVEHEGSWHTLH
ncbi:MAG TPA: peptidase MA family metallohydrolase [Polyangiaceae bacterium]|nr:peptidase MA family metallohydrolase [Polyangiaceae bacterium]